MLRVASHLGSEDRQVMACTCGIWKDTLGSNTSEVSFAWAGRREVDKFDLKPMVSCCIQNSWSCACREGAYWVRSMEETEAQARSTLSAVTELQAICFSAG